MHNVLQTLSIFFFFFLVNLTIVDNELTIIIYRKNLISILGMSDYVIWIFQERKMVKLFANIADPDQMPHSAASDLGLHCLPLTLLGIFRLQWANNFVSYHNSCGLFFIQTEKPLPFHLYLIVTSV